MPHPTSTAKAIALPRQKRLLAFFRAVALFEGLTTILLFCVAMPIKYLLGDPSWVQVMGPLHGYAFLAYMGLMPFALRGPGWGDRAWLRTALAALYPFGTFLNDGFLKRQVQA